MAFTQEGLLGKFSGKLGNLVIYQMNGKIVMRAKPGKRTKPAGGRQKETQTNFARVMGILQPLKSFVKMGFNDLAGGTYVFHKAISENLKRYYDAPDPNDLRWLLLSKGERAGALDLVLEMGEGQATVRWGAHEAGKPFDEDDRVMLLAINTTSLEFTENPSAGKRSQGQASIALPPVKPGEQVLVFISFMDVAGRLLGCDPKNISDSQLLA
ncbi:MAG: DUF6266 family protein [Bacteroides sp.]|nr:DUF6266 family protein [Bacteroides sp.]